MKLLSIGLSKFPGKVNVCNVGAGIAGDLYDVVSNIDGNNCLVLPQNKIMSCQLWQAYILILQTHKFHRIIIRLMGIFWNLPVFLCWLWLVTIFDVLLPEYTKMWVATYFVTNALPVNAKKCPLSNSPSIEYFQISE